MVKFGKVQDHERSQIILPILILAIFLLSGCDKLRQLAHQPEIIQKQQEEIKALNGKISNLEVQLTDIQQELKSQHQNIEQGFAHVDSSLSSLATNLDSLATSYAVIDSSISKHKTCIFGRTSKGCQRLDTDLGQFLISLAGITKHQNDYKLNLNIGNPSMSEIPWFVLHLSYGKAFNQSESTSYEDWRKSLKSREEQFQEHLKPGQWNKIEVPLGTLQPADLEYIVIGMVVDDIILKDDIEGHRVSKSIPK
jgi:SMC interacting uncharacterized protein involved in chromosome segregation